MHRFSLIVLITLLSAACAPAPASPPVKVIPGAVPADRSPDGNTAIFEDDRGLIVVDTGRHFEHQGAILAYAYERKKPIHTIINTHWHLDHSGGNQELRIQFPNAKLYTSDAVLGALDGFLAQELERSRAAIAAPQTDEFEKAKLRLAVTALEDRKNLIPDVIVAGDMTVGELQLHLAPFAATEGDTWIYDPDSRTVVAGDLVVAPVPFFDTACASGWRAALERISKQDFDHLIPGHGPAMTRADFERYHDAFNALLDCAADALPHEVCVAGWQKNAGPFMADDRERTYAARAIAYYLDNILRIPAKQAELCGRAKR